MRPSVFLLCTQKTEINHGKWKVKLLHGSVWFRLKNKHAVIDWRFNAQDKTVYMLLRKQDAKSFCS